MINSLALSIPLFIVIIGYIIFTVKKKYYASLLIAFLLSLAWVLFYGFGYTYRVDNLYLLGKINVFALLGWTAGLMLLFHIFLKLKTRLGSKWKALGLSYLLYLALMLPVEWVGYHLLNIKLTSTYPGLWGLDLMHGPLALKVFYLTAGGFYLLALILLGEVKGKVDKNR